MDRATGWCQAYPTEDQTAETAFRKIVGNWIPNYGVPKKIISDQGGAFTSKLMSTLSKRYAIKQAFTSAYHPQTNGKLERLHKDLGVYMRIFLEGNPGWENLLPNFVYAHNTAEKDRERYSPAYLVYGQELRHPAQVIDNKILWTNKEDAIAEMLQS
jgi:transposase InsO family protein